MVNSLKVPIFGVLRKVGPFLKSTLYVVFPLFQCGRINVYSQVPNAIL